MKFTPLELPGLLQIDLLLRGDRRGFFVERFKEEEFRKAGITGPFIQDNHSRSGPGVLRGLHYQTNPSQGKLMGVIRGRIWDVAVDLRHDSATFGRYVAAELSDENARLLWIPAGFAHGFCVLGEEPADVFYKVTGPYNPNSEGGVIWSDPDIHIAWPIQNPVVSQRDQQLPSFSELKKTPLHWL